MRTWTAAELGAFLDHVADDRLAVAWSLLANTGMRRGEALGLRWADVDLDRGVLRIVRTLIASESGPTWGTPKTAKGRRTVALDAATTAELRGYRARQAAERLSIGPGYDDGDLVVCLPDGRPVHPNTLSYYFAREVKRSGLPAIRLHDLRHTHATLALRTGTHPRVVQERLGHASVGITLDVYSHVDIDMQAAPAESISALIPRRGGSVTNP